MNGQAPSLLNEKSAYQDKPLHAMSALPASIKLQLKSQIIVADAMIALNENGLSYHAACQSNGIRMITRIFNDRLIDLEAESMPLEGFTPFLDADYYLLNHNQQTLISYISQLVECICKPCTFTKLPNSWTLQT